MSYGFYRLPHGTSHDDYIVKVAGKTPVAIGVVIQGNEVVDNTPNIPGDDLGSPLEPPKVNETLTQREDFLAQGYSGDICDNCQGARLRWAGHCKVCDDCGTTTGCS